MVSATETIESPTTLEAFHGRAALIPGPWRVERSAGKQGSETRRIEFLACLDIKA
jgi:hypothetical protein